MSKMTLRYVDKTVKGPSVQRNRRTLFLFSKIVFKRLKFDKNYWVKYIPSIHPSTFWLQRICTIHLCVQQNMNSNHFLTWQSFSKRTWSYFLDIFQVWTWAYVENRKGMEIQTKNVMLSRNLFKRISMSWILPPRWGYGQLRNPKGSLAYSLDWH